MGPPQMFYVATQQQNYRVRCPHCQEPTILVNHISFVDCPDHDVLMVTMLNGVAVMDAAFLLVATNEHVPNPNKLWKIILEKG